MNILNYYMNIVLLLDLMSIYHQNKYRKYKIVLFINLNAYAVMENYLIVLYILANITFY